MIKLDVFNLAMSLFSESDYIYWVDTQANTISRIKRDLTNREVIVKDGLNSVEGLAVDWMGGMLITVQSLYYSTGRLRDLDVVQSSSGSQNFYTMKFYKGIMEK